MSLNNSKDNVWTSDEEFYLKDIFIAFWNKKFNIISITCVAAILSVLYSLSLPNIYVSKSLLVPTEPQDSLISRVGNLSPLTSFSGLNLPQIPVSKSKEAMERVKSYDFFKNFFLPNIKLENLLAVESWNRVNNSIVYKKDVFDNNLKEWTRDVSFPQTVIPSSQEAYRAYTKIISVNEDINTSFVTISIQHQSPAIAKKWLDIIIYQINESMRKVDADQAQRSILYLNEVIETTNVQSIKEVVAKLLEDQMQTLMLTSSNKFYIFKVVEFPIAQEIKSKPNRAMICILGTFIGALLALFLVFFQTFIKPYLFEYK